MEKKIKSSVGLGGLKEEVQRERNTMSSQAKKRYLTVFITDQNSNTTLFYFPHRQFYVSFSDHVWRV